ncbi:MAG: hypothetical protein IT305_05900 [Chloroflexi bacterium]|nr:hypothetical protein [Chloroflexota bacterium]
MDRVRTFYDLPRLLAYRRTLEAVAGAESPAARWTAQPTASLERLGLLPGSFNPPTIAHTSLARAGLATGAFDALAFTLSTRTVDKETVTGAALEDRLLLLAELRQLNDRLGVLAINRGLYVDQAETVRRVFPGVRALVFLVGFDKIVQIFDARYYHDRDAALDGLFAQATFLVAPRGDADDDALGRLLDQPENRRYHAAVQPLVVPTTLRNVASSIVRGSIGAGESADADLPAFVRAFIAATGAYASAGDAGEAGRYARRLAELEALDAQLLAGHVEPETAARRFATLAPNVFETER